MGLEYDRLPHVHMYDRVIFTEGMGIMDGVVIGINRKGLFIRTQTGTVFKKYKYIREYPVKKEPSLPIEEVILWD